MSFRPPHTPPHSPNTSPTPPNAPNGPKLPTPLTVDALEQQLRPIFILCIVTLAFSVASSLAYLYGNLMRSSQDESLTNASPVQIHLVQTVTQPAQGNRQGRIPESLGRWGRRRKLSLHLSHYSSYSYGSVYFSRAAAVAQSHQPRHPPPRESTGHRLVTLVIAHHVT